jgi:hypothetical protein
MHGAPCRLPAGGTGSSPLENMKVEPGSICLGSGRRRLRLHHRGVYSYARRLLRVYWRATSCTPVRRIWGGRDAQERVPGRRRSPRGLISILPNPGLALDWFFWQETETRILQTATLFMGEDVRPEFVMRRCRGETILKEGEEPDAIYLLLGGTAEARVDGVGGPDRAVEAFGRRFTEHPRIACRSASTPCLAQRIERGLRSCGPSRSSSSNSPISAGRVISFNTRGEYIILGARTRGQGPSLKPCGLDSKSRNRKNKGREASSLAPSP